MTNAESHQSSPNTDAFEPDLVALGAESSTERTVKTVTPWVASALIHLGLIGLGFLLTWTVVRLSDDQEPIVVVADFDALTYDPVAQPEVADVQPAERVVQDKVQTPPLDELLDDQLADLELDPLTMISDAASRSELAEFAPQPTMGSASFVGLRTTNARRIVYVIDASGSMIGSLQIVIDELSRSMEALSPRQQFAIIFFQRGEALPVPPGNRLISANRDEKVRALQWIDERIIPSGRSNPLAAIELALSLEPDVIFVLSDNITGSGQFEVDQQDLLDLLDQLNPLDPGTNRRRALIKCIQFLDPDPLDTLRRIAEIHGGENGYRFLDRAELGMVAP